jgi:hypothetical protein
LLTPGARSLKFTEAFMDFRREETSFTFTSDSIRAWHISLTMPSKAFSSRLGERVRSLTAALILRPRSWRTMMAVV